MEIRFTAMKTRIAEAYRAGGLDANGQCPEVTISDGDGNPCRHCLRDIPEGKPMLVLSHRPFSAPQPYAETGPVFLCADPCDRHHASAELPDVVAIRSEFIVRAYDSSERIIGGSGRVLATKDIIHYANTWLDDPRACMMHVRSATNNCYFCTIKRSE